MCVLWEIKLRELENFLTLFSYSLLVLSDMTYNVFGGTLSLTQSINLVLLCHLNEAVRDNSPDAEIFRAVYEEFCPVVRC